LNLKDYSETFLKDGFDDIPTMQKITQEDLAEMGIKRGHQKLILDAIKSTNWSLMIT